MKKALAVLLIASVILACFCSCGKPHGKNEEVKILFVGNSFTGHNSLANMTKNCAKSLGYKNVQVDDCTFDAQTWANYAKTTTECGKKLREMLAAKKYDYVVLQGHNSSGNCREILLELVSQNGATPLFFSTWGYFDGHYDLVEDYNNDTLKMCYAVSDKFYKSGKQFNVDVVYAGLPIYEAYQKAGDYARLLYNGDKKHPGVAMTYISALCFVNKIFGEDPLDVTFVPNNLFADFESLCRECAHNYTIRNGEVYTNYFATKQ